MVENSVLITTVFLYLRTYWDRPAESDRAAQRSDMRIPVVVGGHVRGVAFTGTFGGTSAEFEFVECRFCYASHCAAAGSPADVASRWGDGKCCALTNQRPCPRPFTVEAESTDNFASWSPYAYFCLELFPPETRLGRHLLRRVLQQKLQPVLLRNGRNTTKNKLGHVGHWCACFGLQHANVWFAVVFTKQYEAKVEKKRLAVAGTI